MFNWFFAALEKETDSKFFSFANRTWTFRFVCGYTAFFFVAGFAFGAWYF